MFQTKVVKSSQSSGALSPLLSSSQEPGIDESSSSGALEEKRKLDDMESQLRNASLGAFNSHKRYYIPLKRWQDIMSEQAIRTILPCLIKDSADYFDGQRLADMLKTLMGTKDTSDSEAPPSYRKVLAILILIGKASTIELFVKQRISDIDIPLTRVQENSDGERNFSLRKEKSGEKLACFDHWKQREIESFDTHQWELSAPFFSRGMQADGAYELSPDHPLPFHPLEGSNQVLVNLPRTEYTIGATTSDGLRGAYGQVTRITIHPEHHDIRSHAGTEENPKFAIKYLFKDRPERMEAFKNEVQILSRLNTSNDDHLVKLILTMEIKSHDDDGEADFYLMFPLAERNLRQFWTKTPASSSYCKWFARQCYGITIALGKFHNLHTIEPGSLPEQHPETKDPFYGIHGDIKPANLLCFQTGDRGNDVPPGAGVIKLADFGTSSIHHTDTIKSVHKVQGTTTYRPPEGNLLPAYGCTQSYDIWSLGCVFLEFGCWMVQGGKGVEDFQNARKLEGKNRNSDGNIVDTFYYNQRKGKIEKNFVVNPAVKKLISNIKSSDECSPFISELFKIIEKHMIVIEKKRDSDTERKVFGGGAEKSRILCSDLSQELKRMIEHGENDYDYFQPRRHSGTTRKILNLVKEPCGSCE